MGSPQHVATQAVRLEALAALDARLATLTTALEGLAALLTPQPATAQGQRLLTLAEVADVLSVSTVTARRMAPRLVAKGLKVVTIPAASRRDDKPRKAGRPASMIRYTAASLARLIARAADTERPLC